jgi:prepilin-type N-terminal cleavage/methylation domain-containing protein
MNDERWTMNQVHSNCGLRIADCGIKTPNSELRTVNSKGFTLTEVILIMAIIGILSATAVSRINFTLPTTASVDGAAYMIASDIRYVQECAMANRLSKSIRFTSGNSSYTFPATIPSTSMLDPSGQLSTGAVVGTTITFTFNSLGEPIAGGGNSVIVRDVGSTEQRTIQVQNYTGKVNISNP